MQAKPRQSAPICRRRRLLVLILAFNLINLPLRQVDSHAHAHGEDEEDSSQPKKTHVKIGLLLEESNNVEQANMFIRTIKMINEQRDETIGQLFASNAGGEGGEGAKVTQHNMQRDPPEVARGRRAGGGGGGGQSIGRRRRRFSARNSTTDKFHMMKLEPMIEFLADRQSALEADVKVCQLINSGVRALVGPLDGHSIQHVQSICDNLEIAYFELRPFLGGAGTSGAPIASLPVTDKRDSQTNPLPPTQQQQQQMNKLEDLTLNLYPPSYLLNVAYIDLIHALNWTSFAIVYESSDSMIRLQNIFKESSPAGSWANKWRIRLFRYDDDERSADRKSAQGPEAVKPEPEVGARKESAQGKNAGATFRDVFWRVKLSGEHNILLDVKTEMLYEALKQAQQVGCMTDEFSYLITSLDLHTIDLEDFKYSRTKLTSFSLLQVAKDDQSVLRKLPPATGSQQHGVYWFDEKYLENLGVHLAASHAHAAHAFERQATGQIAGGHESLPAHHSGAYLNYVLEAESNDATRRELLQSSPASLGLLPTIDRNNEQRLFDFFLELQDRNMSRLRLSTSSAILHDSLLLYMLGLYELDPSGGAYASGVSESPLSSSSSSDGATTSSNDETCRLESSSSWSQGSSLVNYMRQMTFNGLTGRISFDQRGLRSDFKLDVMGMAPNIRLVKIGEWHSKYAHDSSASRLVDRTSGGFVQAEKQEEPVEEDDQQQQQQQQQPTSGGQQEEEFKSYDELSSKYEAELAHYTKLLESGQQVQVPYTRRVSPNGALRVNEIIFERLYREQADKIDTLIVTAKLSQPYFMLKETPNKLNGNDQYEGYAVDLIHELAKLVNFKYKWREVGDKKYGSKETLPNGTVVWNGMIGEIVRGQADLAIVDLTITAQREEAVDFTLPFMNTGISILFKKPTTKVTTLFSFLSPFSSDVWAYVLAAYCGISAILFLVGHLSPYEWADPHPCRHLTNSSGTGSDDYQDDQETTTSRVLKNQFSLLNSFWFTIGSLMQQGSDLTPRSMSTRTIAGIWYFFTLIMISSYTANLAAFLTVEKVVYPIENVRDLSAQSEIKYGCVESGSTCLFFHDSQIDTYKQIDRTMRHHRTYVRSNDEGQKRVGEGKFAFFMESTTIEYIIERNCNLTQIGGLIDSKGYGLATSKKSRHKRPYRTLLNEGILHLQETGMLHVLKNRWWKEKRGGGTCTDDGKGGGVTELSLANVGGVFVVLLGGLGISFLVAIAEFIWRARRSGSTRDRMCEEMMNDLKFALACKSSTKPITQSGNGNNFKRRTGRTSATATAGAGATSSTAGPAALIQEGDYARSHYLRAAHIKPVLANGGPNYQPVRPPYHAIAANQNIDLATPLAKGSKNCDPILLHAMLTMLSQQQPQPQSLMHQAMHKRTISQPYLNDGTNNLEIVQQQQQQQRLYGDYHHDEQTVLVGGRFIQHSATMDENLNRSRHFASRDDGDEMTSDNDDNDVEYDDDNDDDDDDEQGQFNQVNEYNQRHARLETANTINETTRRRMLHAQQQTIDTDE